MRGDDKIIHMFQEFLNSYMQKARYELIDMGKTYYGEISPLRGVWATGETLEDCRKNLLETVEGWVLLRLRKNLPIPNFKIPYQRLRLGAAYAKT